MVRGRAMVAMVAVSTTACSYDFDAASVAFGRDPGTGAASSSSASTGGSGGDGGAPPVCHPVGEPGAFNPAGEVGSTPPYTFWYWPQDVGDLTSLEWSLNVDFEPPNDGYFWAHQFGFQGPDSAAGFVGIQEHGTYIADPPDGPVDITKMALFSIGPGSLLGEAGVPYPDGSARNSFDEGAGWSIHARYPWQPCHSYAFRIAHMNDEPSGDQWYGAWVVDTTAAEETFIGRILVPGDWGRFEWWTVFFSERFGFNQIVSCDIAEHASAVFSYPTANGGRVEPTTQANQFQDPPHCPSSRFTMLPGAIRHEMGVPAGR